MNKTTYFYLPVTFLTVQKSSASNVMTMTNMNTVLVNFIGKIKYLENIKLELDILINKIITKI